MDSTPNPVSASEAISPIAAATEGPTIDGPLEKNRVIGEVNYMRDFLTFFWLFILAAIIVGCIIMLNSRV